MPVSISRRTAGSNAALTPSPQERESPAWWISSRMTRVAPGHGAPAVHLRRHADLGVGDHRAVEVGGGVHVGVAERGVELDADPGRGRRPTGSSGARSGATTVTASTVPSASSSAAIRRANVVLPAPGVATARKSSAAPAQVLHQRLALPGPQRAQRLPDSVATRPPHGLLPRPSRETALAERLAKAGERIAVRGGRAVAIRRPGVAEAVTPAATRGSPCTAGRPGTAPGRGRAPTACRTAPAPACR